MVSQPPNKSTVGGHLLKANRDRGLGVHTATVLRYNKFVGYPRKAPNDRANVDTGTPGNGAALAAKVR